MRQCEICGKELSERGYGPHFASHREGGLRGDKREDRPPPSDRPSFAEPLFSDIPPRSREKKELDDSQNPKSSEPQSIAPPRQDRYSVGIGFVGAGLSLALRFDEWEDKHWQTQGPVSAKILAKYVDMYPDRRESKVIDAFFGGPDWLYLLEALMALGGPILAHRGIIPWPGVERGTYTRRVAQMAPQQGIVVEESPPVAQYEDDTSYSEPSYDGDEYTQVPEWDPALDQDREDFVA